MAGAGEGGPCGLTIAGTRGNWRALRFLYFHPWGSRTAPGRAGARGRLLPSRGHGEQDALRARHSTQGWHRSPGPRSPTGSAPGPGCPARPRRRWRRFQVQVADSSRFLVPFGCASSSTAPPAAPRGAAQGLGLLPIHQLLICSQHPSWATPFSCASQGELPKAPDPGATSWLKVISWRRQLESRFPMFSSGLSGSCCSRGWDRAGFCTPTSLRDTRLLHSQTCHCSPEAQLGGMLGGVKAQLALGQARSAGTAVAPKPLALKGAP